MALFPDSTTVYYDDQDVAIKSQMESFYTQSMMINQSYQYEAAMDTRFNIGDQTVWGEIYSLPIRTRKNFSFNIIRPIINLTSGYQRKNRKSIVVTPVENSDQKTADQFTKLIFSAERNNSILDTISEAYNGAIVTGMNLLHVWVDYRNDPISGEIKVDNCAYNSFIIDPFFRKKDLSDCNALWKRSFLTKDACISLVPDKKKEIEDMQSFANDGKFNFLPENTMLNQNLLAYDEFYYRDYRKQKLLVDSNLGETIEWSGDDETLKDFLSKYPQITVVETKIPTVKLALLINGKVVFNDINPLGIDKFPFIPVLGYFTPEADTFSLRVQGMVRGLRDVQYLFNRRKILDFDMSESRSNSGYIYKEDSLVDPDDPLKVGNGRGIRLKREAQMTDIMPIPPIEIPASQINLGESLLELSNRVSGVNEELLGSATDDKAGILSKLRQGAGLTTLQVLFDQLDNSQKLLGQIMVEVIQKNYTPGKVKRIIEEEPSEQFYNKAFGKYDIAIEEGLDTATHRGYQLAQLLHFKEIGIEIPDDVIINAATIQNKQELIASLAQQKQQVQKLQEEQAQGNKEEQQATINMVNSRAESDKALADKRMSEIETDKIKMIYEAAFKAAEAAIKEQNANMDAIKTLGDIDDNKVDKLDDLLDMAQIIQEERKSLNTEEQPVAQQEDSFENEQGLQPQQQIPQQNMDEQLIREQMMQEQAQQEQVAPQEMQLGEGINEQQKVV